MSVPAAWEPLAAMRGRGLRPAGPVVVTTDIGVARRKFGDGSLVIVHQRGDSLPMTLLADLDVLFNFDRCDRAGRVYELMARRGVLPASVRTWCHCAGHPVVAAWPCERFKALSTWET